MVNSLNKIVHDHPMLSLDKTKDPHEVENFVKGQDWFAMFKMDGLTCSLTYRNGNLVQAETRGNGTIGEDILHNVSIMKNVPKHIPVTDEKIVIDGEIICTYKDFEQFKNEYKNPRNFASGSIRLLDSHISAARNLTFVAWDLVKGCDDIDFFFWRLEKLDDWGFITVPRVGDAETVHDAMNILDNMRDGKDAYKNSPYQDYPIDGYVFKFESVKYGKSLGYTDHHAKNAIAYKFYDEEYETTLKDIEWSMGRTGILSPVAIYDDVEIDGSICNRASLHNLSILEETLGTPYIGQEIRVFKANQIIPQISYGKPMKHFGGAGYILTEPKQCPICGEPTAVKVNNEVKTLWCENSSCEGKLINQIDHYVGKKGLDIKGLSIKTIEKLINWGWINGFKDIYKLTEHRTEWMAKEGFGAASVEKILNAITSSRSQADLSAFISALGIPLVGGTISKEIVKYYSTWEDFRNAVGGDWTQFEGFGPEISKAINNFDYNEADEIAEFLDFKQPEVQNNDALNGTSAIKDKVFVITGKLSRKRDEIKSEIESLGGKVTGSVSSKTDYLICNDKNSTTGKSADAKKLGISIITEEEYLKMKS